MIMNITPRNIDTTSFTRIKLSELDTLQGQSLGQVQKDVLQNRRADIAEEIIHLVYSENKDDKYGLHLAYLQGQLDLITNLIVESDAATGFIVSESSPN